MQMHLVVDRPTDENATVISGSFWEVTVCPLSHVGKAHCGFEGVEHSTSFSMSLEGKKCYT